MKNTTHEILQGGLSIVPTMQIKWDMKEPQDNKGGFLKQQRKLPNTTKEVATML
jgi:hypothetical protein